MTTSKAYDSLVWSTTVDRRAAASGAVAVSFCLAGTDRAGGAPQRHGEFFSSPLAAANTTPVWAPMTVNATQGSTNQTVAGRVFIPANPESFLHDLDGNLTRDGRWDYTWDAENRLVSMETIPAAFNAGAPRQRLVFAYDWQGRRIRKTVSNWVLGQWSVVTDHSFVYDGWNLLAVLGPGNTPLQSFVWGTDASGSMQGAGGVGGLLATRVHTGPNAGTYFYCYDGNWNVVGLVNALSGSVAARYEYGPFHELIRASGPMASENHLQAATKYRDSETGLYYYGYRYYNPGTGRWLSRDPMGEKGGANLFGFVDNDPLSGGDALGLRNGNPVAGGNLSAQQSFPWDPVAPPLIIHYNPDLPQSAAWLSAKDKWIPWGRVRDTKETDWFFRHPEAREATSRASSHFRRIVEANSAALCRDGSSSLAGLSSFFADWRWDEDGGVESARRKIRHIEAPPRPIYYKSWPVYEDEHMGTFVIGDWEYRLRGLKINRDSLNPKWTAEIEIVDKLGWDEKFGRFGERWGIPDPLRRPVNLILNTGIKAATGEPREFRRGAFIISGDLECCLSLH